MSQKNQVFEKEEATKLLDYFIAYKKLQNKIDYIKCVAALNSSPNLDECQMHTKSTLQLGQTHDNILQRLIDLPRELEK